MSHKNICAKDTANIIQAILEALGMTPNDYDLDSLIEAIVKIVNSRAG